MKEEIKKIITLGPKGTFSNLAASMVGGSSSYEIEYTNTIPSITKAVEKNPNALGVMPIENSVAGIVGQAQDSLIESNVVICNELSIHVNFSLISHVPLNEVKSFYAHPQAFDQTAKFTANNMPNANVIFTHSNIQSGEKCLEMEGEPVAAIIPFMVAQEDAKYRKLLKADNIQDHPNNITRFISICSKPKGYEFDFNCEKTSLYIELSEDRHSQLFELLREFHVYDINLCRLESRPSKTHPWVYVFYIDFYNQHRTQKCLEGLSQLEINYRILGSYNKISLSDVKG